LALQSKHIENDLNKNQKMTTGIAIKCKDGIVLASDSQGTINDSMKKTIDKVFEIKIYMGLVGARKDHHVRELVRYFENIPVNYKTEIELTNYLYKNVFELCEKKI
jgi:20S proteasome alpha/beta subunit